MRKQILKQAALALVVSGGLMACQGGENIESLVLDALDLSTEMSLESSFEEVDELTESGMQHPDDHHGGRGFGFRDPELDCAVVERDTVNKVITIDFGDGCEGKHGVVRKGKVIIHYSDRRYVPGAYRVVTFENFYLDSVKVEGVRTITNTTDSTASQRFEVTLEGGRLIFPDSTFVTREANHVRTWYRGETPEENSSTLTGSAHGTLRAGEDYTVGIVEELVFKRDCRRGRAFLPVSGQIQVTSGSHEALIDFGDGTCDNVVEITIDGETTTREINPRGRRHRGK